MESSSKRVMVDPALKSEIKKALVIGIDGGTLDIILPMAQDGKLPNLSKLLENGAYGTLMSTIPPVTAPAWSSFITGTNPGKHGVFYFFKREKDNYSGRRRKVLMNLKHIHGIPFWKILNQYQKKVALINIPLTYPPQKLDGFMISGMLVPQGSDDYTYPLELLSRLNDYYVDIDGLMVNKEWRGEKLIRENRQKFIKSVFDLSNARFRNALRLMKEEKWDFFMVVFTGSDRICHFFWKDLEIGNSLSSIVMDYFIFLDDFIGQLMTEAGKDSIKIVMSDHGFGPAPTKRVNAVELMKKLKCTEFVPYSPLLHLKNRLLSKIARRKHFSFKDLINYNRSKIFLEPIYANFLGIYINAIGAFPYGVVSPGEEYNKLREEIIKVLEKLKDPMSGKQLVEKIYLRESIYQGPFTNEAADIVAQFSYDYKVGYNPLRKALVLKLKNSIRNGEHRREGIFIASGPQISSGRIENEIQIQDLTPTILYLFGAPIPRSYDGILIKELFNEKYLAQNPPQYDAGEKYIEIDPNGITDDSQNEFKESKKLLENLGYM
jgi:predicted AlkP superfamily phosphohydrolase/phosphomutase